MAVELKTLKLKCPHCGAPLDVSPDMERFSCGYCGSEQVVLRRGGTVALGLIGDAITKVQAGTDKTAAELAIMRLRDDLKQEQVRYQAWLVGDNLRSSDQGLVKLGILCLAVGMTFTYLGFGNGNSIVILLGIFLTFIGIFSLYLQFKAEATLQKLTATVGKNYSDRSAEISRQIAEKLKEVT